ncbi:MAG: MerR family transcriptional regulator [Chloroflexales bacterium]|nr:MerR family transcriptional regulator [Chloroflexales bacterium]
MRSHNGDKLLTIGQLAKRANLRPSALRYYEAEGLLEPNAYTDSGYRLYGPDAERTLAFIQHAQRLGFSLADIHTLLRLRKAGAADHEALARIAEERYLALEQQLTPLLALRHELGLFLRDLQAQTQVGNVPNDTSIERLIERVCADQSAQPPETMLNWLLDYTGCQLTSAEGQTLIAQLSGQHVHVWQDNSAYHVLVVSDDPAIGVALKRLAQLEADCRATSEDQRPEVHHDAEGYRFVARGDHAFLFARLFLALEQG